MIVKVRVIPNSSCSDVVGRIGSVLRVKVAARAVDGEANSALQEYLAEFFEVKPRMVRIIRGERGREKTLEINGRTEEELKAMMESIP